ncbi:MAG: choline dehydrogenase [Paracoccaceae bacterium]|nr:choline dehydrogenase [Paracoccaceae bacterium]
MRADYVIVGSGSAGAALAYRLAEAGRSVIVIEAGGSDAGPFIQMPGALSYPMNMGRYDWGLRTEPEPHLGGRRLAVPRGRVVGGSSSINGMVWVRGHAGDFDHWAAAGATGWAFRDVLPYYRRLEDWDANGQGGDPAWRGAGGPVRVTRGPRANPLFDVFVAAAEAVGYARTPDYNGHRQEGVGPADQTVHRGRRWSAARAYLIPALRRFNCRLVQGEAARIRFDGKRAIGVDLTGGAFVSARREVILAASAINSPKLLMQSGIGPGAALQALGIAVVADRPGVGQNLQDHLEVSLQIAARQPITLYRYWNTLGKTYVALRWLLTRTGPGASNQIETLGFVRSRAGVDYPDIQFHFFPIAMRYDGQAPPEGHGFQAHVGPMRSAARGRVALVSPDPAAPPSILFNYMSSPSDWQEFRAGIRLLREIFAAPPFAPHVAHEIQPGEAVSSDQALDAFVRDHAESAYHPCGTCRMGAADDPMAVVDPETRVIGVEGLRVADSSVFPRITNGNINAPSILVGEKAADHIIGRAPLPPDDRLPWVHRDWQRAQR